MTEHPQVPEIPEHLKLPPPPAMSTLRYLGYFILTYALAVVLMILAYFGALAWGGAKLIDAMKDIPLLNVFGTMYTVILVPFFSVALGLYTSLLYIPHALVMFVFMGIRQRGTIASPIPDLLVSGALMVALAYPVVVVTEVTLDFWTAYGLVCAGLIGVVIGGCSYRLSKARQAGLAA